MEDKKIVLAATKSINGNYLEGEYILIGETHVTGIGNCKIIKHEFHDGDSILVLVKDSDYILA